MTVVGKTFQTLRGNFAPLRQPNFRLYLGGQAVSLIGTWLQVTAQSWVVWQLTGSEAALGIVTMLNGLPILFFSPYAGVWIDRLDRRKLLIGTQVTSMVLAFILAFLSQTHLVQIWHVYVLSLLLGIANSLDLPAQQAFLGDLSGMADIRKAVNLNVTIIQVSRILGPALAGMIVARLGVAPAFWLNGLSFLAVIASLVLVSANQVFNKHNTDGPLKQIGQAFAYLRQSPRMQDVFLLALLLTVFVFSIIMSILPAVADKLLNGDAETLGWLLASSGAGALVAVLIIVPITQSFKRSGVVMISAVFWLSLWLTVFAHSHSLLLSVLALFMGSMGAPTVMTMTMGLVQLMSPPQMRGRLISLFTTLSFGMMPLAALLLGQSAQYLGVETAIQVNAILLALGGVVMVVSRPQILSFEYGAATHTESTNESGAEPSIEAEPIDERAIFEETIPVVADVLVP